MLSALLRPFRGTSSQTADHADLEQDFAFRPSVAEYRSHPHATADFTEADDDDEEEESNDAGRSRFPLGGIPEDEDGAARSSGFLPLFSDNHLDSLPIYSMTHAIRIIVQARTETTLTWEQLRSPQVSQFLVKPMQQQIRAQHFSTGTIYALMANCLQFEKEGQLYPANAGTSATRARVCELLAIKLLKEYTTRELIEALCYDFYPLQGISGSQSPLAPGASRPKSALLRTSTLEVAIRASAKQFLSHPLVVQHLEAIWNGAISFPSPAEELKLQASTSSATSSNQSRRQSTIRTPLLGDQRIKGEPSLPQSLPAGRRSMTLYNPRSASLFKLSRLRVPRYRRILSTCSLIVLLCLFITVLWQRSSKITTLELVFWFWSAGFMLDELVGFNEQGFSFCVMGFWNILDLGILLLLIVYYCMRIYGVFLLDPHQWNQNAYDVLAVNAILLLPKVFNVLDHFRHFSKLFTTLRLLAIDLAAVSVIILICCAGFFVFFAFSKNADDASAVAYKMFQILVGSTPSAWEMWSSYNWVGKTFMGLFLIITHFIILTMLITVLTNSFMSIASRASQEYHFTFAINTISMAKDDALFSYVAPGNVFAWALMPLRYCMSMDQYVRLNRAVIKITHFPLLFCIYLYERWFLAPDMYEATDLVDKSRRGRYHLFSDPASRSAFFSPSNRIREGSVVGYQRDRALEEVFRRGPDMRSQRRNERRKTQTAIRTWMDQHDGEYNSPRNYSTIDSRLSSDWLRRLSMNRQRPSRFPRHYSDMRSTASDPADFISDAPYPMAAAMYNDGVARRDYAIEVKENTDGDGDGDDELVTNDEDEGDDATNTIDDRALAGEHAIEEDYFTTPVATRFTNTELSMDSPRPPTSRRIPLHTRTLSTNTILYAPEDPQPYSSSSASAWPVSRPLSRPLSTRPTPVATPVTPGTGRRSPRRSLYLASRPRSMIQPGDLTSRTTSGPRTGGLTLDIPTASPISKPPVRRRSLTDLIPATPAASAEADDPDTFSSPAMHHHQHNSSISSNRAMLAKMKSLEASLGYMVREMRTLRKSVPNTACNSDEGAAAGGRGGGGDGGSGGGGGSASRSSWQQQYYAYHHRQGKDREREREWDKGFRPGSDPSLGSVSFSGVDRGQALIEVAVAQGRERDKVGGGGVRRKSMMMGGSAGGGGGVSTPTSRRGVGTPGSRRQQGAWRSPGAEGAAGLGINTSSVEGVERREMKGKGRERERVEQSHRTGSSPMTGSGSDGLGVAGKGISL